MTAKQTKQRCRSLRWKLAKKMLTDEERSLLWGIHKAVVSGYKMADNTDQLEQGKEVYIRAKIAFNGVVKDLVTCKNDSGYYFTVPKSNIALRQYGYWDEECRCSECRAKDKKKPRFCRVCGSENKVKSDEKKGK